MKKFLLLFSLFLIPALSKSQPVLSSSSLPEIGTGITRYFCDTTGVNEGQGGADRSWNFSDIQKNNEPAMEVTYIEPSETPYASNFPTANIAIDQDTLFSFYENSSNQIVRLGIQGEDIKETLTDTEISLTLPFTYGDTHSDTFEGTIETTIQGTPYTMNRSGSLTAEADAYGSITLPTGTFNNVLRVKHTYVLEDELPVVIPGMPSPIMITEVISYDWMHPDFYYPVFSISYNTLSYENFPGMEDLESMSVHYTSTEPASGDIPLPSITAPVDGATGVSLPVELSWVVPESGKTKEKGNTDLDHDDLGDKNFSVSPEASVKDFELKEDGEELKGSFEFEAEESMEDVEKLKVSSDFSDTSDSTDLSVEPVWQVDVKDVSAEGEGVSDLRGKEKKVKYRDLSSLELDLEVTEEGEPASGLPEQDFLFEGSDRFDVESSGGSYSLTLDNTPVYSEDELDVEESKTVPLELDTDGDSDEDIRFVDLVIEKDVEFSGNVLDVSNNRVNTEFEAFVEDEDGRYGFETDDSGHFERYFETDKVDMEMAFPEAVVGLDNMDVDKEDAGDISYEYYEDPEEQSNIDPEVDVRPVNLAAFVSNYPFQED
ncbi:MAG: hypothetical protein ACOC2K_02910, partial [Bacteroidota bacterium]